MYSGKVFSFIHHDGCEAVIMSPTSQMRKLGLTEPESTLQMSGSVGLRFRPSLPARGHRAASLLEDRLPGLEKWSVTLPAIVAPQGLLNSPCGWWRWQRRWNPTPCAKRPGCKATSFGWSMKRCVGLRQKLRCCPWDRWSRGKQSGLYGPTISKMCFIFHHLCS